MNSGYPANRRQFPGNVSTGLMGVGLQSILASEKRGGPHFPARAKRVLQIFCPGAASHMDLWEQNLYCASRASGVDGLLNWDAHKTLKPDYERHCPVFDQPTAALLTDLKQRGLMEDALVLWTTEFGRMPTNQQGTAGRDHNPDGFTLWMMGAGVKGGASYGATNQFGRRAEQNPTTVWEFYSTVLHLLGLDFEQLSWYHNGLDRRLTDVHGHVVRDVLA